jgi:hypothetical protein
MTAKEGNPMDSVIAACDTSLADKPLLASIYSTAWRQEIASKLRELSQLCYLPYAFGYQAPLLEYNRMVHRCWQYRLEEGACVLLPKLNNKDRGHLEERMRGAGSTSAEEELLLARGFALEFGREAIRIPQTLKRPPEFEVDARGHRILAEAKGRVETEFVAGRRQLESILGAAFPPVADLDDGVGCWLKRTIKKTLVKKSFTPDVGFVLAMSVYTLADPLRMIHSVRESAMDPATLGLLTERWPLVLALVSGGSILGVWFNSTVRDRLGIDTTAQERIREAIKSSFYPREDGVFFHEGMTDDEHRSGIDRMFGVGAK